MKHPLVTTEVKHSESKNAWNVIGAVCGGKYKIARVPYNQLESKDSDMYNTRKKVEALEHALFISFCFNNPNKNDLLPLVV